MGGNILSRTEYAYTLANTEKLTNGREFIYEYNTNGWADQLSFYDSSECSNYDPLGNPRAYRGSILTWSHCRQLDQISGVNNQTAKFAYNADGIRISKQIGTVKTEYYLDGTTILAQKSGNQMVYFNYGIDGVDGFTHNNKEYYYRKNIQGDILAIMDENGAEIVQYVYDAWGNHNTYVLSENNTYLDISKVTSNEYVAIAQLNPYRYRGYYYDVETGLYYLNARYYDPEVGRFINADDISEVEPEDIDGLNLYAYCLNNPVMFTDQNGNRPRWLSWLIGALVVVAVTAAVVLTAGAAAVAIGASAAVTAGVMAGAAIGGLVVGGATLIEQGTSGGEMDYGKLALNTFVGSAVGAVLGGGAGYLLGGGAAATIGGGSSLAFAGGGTMSAGVAVVGKGVATLGIIGALVLSSFDGGWPGDDPTQAPEEFEWRGKGPVGSNQGNWYNPETGEILHPDLNHPNPIGPHWDYRDALEFWWRIFKKLGKILKKK